MENVNKINNLAYLDIFLFIRGVWLACTPNGRKKSSFEALDADAHQTDTKSRSKAVLMALERLFLMPLIQLSDA
jgi:hypothetical protein